LRETVTVLILFLIPFLQLRAQRFGGNPPSVKWEQIDSDTVRVIFPRGLEREAGDVANIIHRLNGLSGNTIGGKIRKVNIVMQNQTINSNGYVALGPFRSEFFLTPRQNSFELGSLPWHKTLALHEYRHVQQYNNFRKGISKVFYYIFGEQGLALANSAAVPDWFFEGDAVNQETLLSNQGRGRLPYFLNPYKAIWSSGKKYSWMKLRNGSYRDLLPDHYDLGYMLVDYGRRQYGDTIWKNIAGDAARFKGLFYPLQRAVKKYTGEDYKTFRAKALKSFSDKLVSRRDSSGAYAAQHKHLVANEVFPQWLDDDRIVYLKSNYDHIPAFVIRNLQTGTEKQIRKKDISSDNYFSLRNNRIVYTAFATDPRWQWRDYSVIRVIDVNTGAQRRITKKTKYFSPDISADGRRIAAVLSDPSGLSAIHIIDAVSGKITDTINDDEGWVYTYPKFFGANSTIAAVRNKNGEMAMVLFDLKTKKQTLITPFGIDVIGYPGTEEEKITFSMTYKGKDEIFVWEKGKIFRVVPEWGLESAGSYQLSVRKNNFVWTNFTAAGYHITSGKPHLEPFAFDRAEPSSRLNLITDVTERYFKTEPYSKSYQLFNFHSWRPYISDPEYSYIVSGENILNTFLTDIYFTYNRNEKYKETGASLSYGALFPVFNVSGAYTFDRSFTDSSGETTWNEFNASIGASVPLTFTHGIYSTTLNSSASIVRKQLSYTGASKNKSGRQFNSADLSFSFTNQQTKAVKNIYPRFAQAFSVRYRSVLNRYTARQTGINASLYFPGLFTNHSVVIQGAYQARDTLQEYNFSNTFPFSRGYAEVNFPRMWKVAANYHLPVAYPDAGFGNIVYLLRLRANAFYDFSQIKSLASGRRYNLRTAGLELYVDSRWWNQVPVTFGFRYSRLLNNELTGQRPDQFEFILPVNIL
jgi:hypothetical protein